jgi:hypothetical protein
MKTLQQAVAALDRDLSSLGFERTARFGVAGWRGLVEGRACNVSVKALRRTRYYGEVRSSQLVGYKLNVDLETSVRTKLFLVKRSFARNPIVRVAYRVRRQVTVADLPPPLQDFHAVVGDETWARRFLEQGEAVGAAAELLREDATPAYMGSVYFMPTSESGRLYYASPIVSLEALTTERAQRVIERLESILRVAEALPPPEVPVRVGRFGRLTEKHPWVGALAVLGGLGLIFTTLGLALSLALVLLALWMS